MCVAGSSEEVALSSIGELAIMQIAEGTPSDRVEAHVGLAFATTAVGKALAVAAVFLIAAFDAAGPYAAVQIAKAITLRALLAPFVHTPLATAVGAAEASTLRTFAAAIEAAARAAAVTFAQSVGLRTLVTAFHSAGLALDPTTILV